MADGAVHRTRAPGERRALTAAAGFICRPERVFHHCWAAVTAGAASKPPAPFVVVSETDGAASHSPPHDRSLEARRCAAESSSVSGESAKLTLSPALL